MRQAYLKGAATGLILGLVTSVVAEEIKLVTYYPSPRGVYEELRTTGTTTLATQAGSVGIRTTSPATLLEAKFATNDFLQYGGSPRLVVQTTGGFAGALRLKGNTSSPALEVTGPNSTDAQYTVSPTGPGLNLNFTAAAASAGTTTQNSPTLVFTPRWWNGSASVSASAGNIASIMLSASGATTEAGLELNGAGGAPGNHQLFLRADGNVGIGNTAPDGRFVVSMPATQTIAATNTITGDGCGTVKRITAASAVTTNTTNTFTAPSASNSGCRMSVCNVGASSITLDNNALFQSAAGANVVLTAADCVEVASTGVGGAWYQLAPVSAN